MSISIFMCTTSLFLAMVFSIAFASDPDSLQDFCVADLKSELFVNGELCKNPKIVTPDDFLFKGFNIPRNTDNKVGSNVTLVNVDMLPGLNTLGTALARLDFAPYGLNPPHTHPRGTEIFTVIEGEFLVGFVTSNPENRLISAYLKAGDIFVFPIGLIHFQLNLGKTEALGISGFSSQNPGVITIANAVFDSKPPISNEVLMKAFQVDQKVIDLLEAQFKS